jgi:hypothetical protein
MFVQVKRADSSFLILADEYETVESLKRRLLDVLLKTKLTMKGYDAPFTIDDLCLNEQNRVSLIAFSNVLGSVE